MKKQEFDILEKVYNTSRIVNDEPNDSQNSVWWKKSYHSTDEESKNPDMMMHEIAFNGTTPIGIKSITKHDKKIFNDAHFDASFKQR